jgi:hypothetical protein
MCKQKKKTPAAIFINSRQRHPIEWSLTLIAQDKIAGHGLPYKLMNDNVYTHNLVTWDHWNQKYTLTCNSPKTYHFNSKNTTKRVEWFLAYKMGWPQVSASTTYSEEMLVCLSTHLLWASMTLMNHVTELYPFAQSFKDTHESCHTIATLL